MASYTKKCQCGKLINIRKMPNGRWVAFEGYDTLHKHPTAVPETNSSDRPVRKARKTDRERDTFDDLEFSDIAVEPGKKSKPKISPHPQKQPPSYDEPRTPLPDIRPPAPQPTRSILIWVWVAIAAGVIILLLTR